MISRKPFSKSNGYVILAAPGSKEKLADSKILAEALAAGKGVLIVDLWGTGETNKTDNEDLMYHDLTRAVLWLGKTMMGEWCRDFALLASHLRMSCPGSQMEVGGLGAAGLAALLFSAMDGNAVPVILERSTVSLVFHREAPSDYSTMVYYIPGFLGFGDLSLAAALTGGVVRFIAPVSSDGAELDREAMDEFSREFDRVRHCCGSRGSSLFAPTPSTRLPTRENTGEST